MKEKLKNISKFILFIFFAKSMYFWTSVGPEITLIDFITFNHNPILLLLFIEWPLNIVDKSIIIYIVAKKFGVEVPFLRPQELAADTSKTIEAILHLLEELNKIAEKYDVLVLLQPTSPLRTSEDIDKAIQKFFKFDQKSLVSVSKVKDSPILMRTIIAEDKMEKILSVSSTVRRQDMPDFYKVNGAIYINKISEINASTSFNDNEVPFIMSSSHSVDVDEYKDLEIVKYFLSGGNKL